MAYDFGVDKSGGIVQAIMDSYVYRYEPSTNKVFVGTKKGVIKTFYIWDGRQDNVIDFLKEIGLI